MSATALRPSSALRTGATPFQFRRERPDRRSAAGERPSFFVLAALALATSVSPFSTDMYLTALPRMAGQFAVSTSMIELTLTAFLLGLGFGQLVIGPLSDSIGRRRPPLVGVACCIAASSSAPSRRRSRCSSRPASWRASPVLQASS